MEKWNILIKHLSEYYVYTNLIYLTILGGLIVGGKVLVDFVKVRKENEKWIMDKNQTWFIATLSISLLGLLWTLVAGIFFLPYDIDVFFIVFPLCLPGGFILGVLFFFVFFLQRGTQDKKAYMAKNQDTKYQALLMGAFLLFVK